MGTVLFYHLIRSTPAELLATNLSRALAQGWRVMVRGTDLARLTQLDAVLWRGGEEFLPHGLEGGPQDADQPVLLGQGAAVNGAKVLALIDGARVEAAELAGMERVWVLFDGQDAPRVEAARTLWKTVVGGGHVAQYWTDESGRWKMERQSPAPEQNGNSKE